LPIGTYSGNKLNLQSQSSPGCGYTPAEIQTAYNLTGLYSKGFNGTGQTIAIVDGAVRLRFSTTPTHFRRSSGCRS
jgi:subtilase family serine protease